MRIVQRELLLGALRFGIFLCLQLLSSPAFAPARRAHHPYDDDEAPASSSSLLLLSFPILNTLVASSYCWLLLGVFGGLWVGYDCLVARRRRSTAAGPASLLPTTLPPSLAASSSSQRRRTSLLKRWQQDTLFAQTATEEEEEVDEEERRLFYLEQTVFPHTTPSVTSFGFDAFPFSVWSAMHACGFVFFVIGYSLSGLFWLPQLTFLLMVLALLVAQPPARPPVRLHAAEVDNDDVDDGVVASSSTTTTKLSRYAWRAGLALLFVAWYLLFVYQLYTDGYAPLFESITSNLWLGVLVPAAVGRILLRWYTQRHKPRRLQEEEEEATTAVAAGGIMRARSILSFALPSLVMISLTCLSLYLPTQECSLQLAPLASVLSSSTNNNNNNNNNTSSNRSTTTTTTSSRWPDVDDQQTTATLMVFLLNASHTYYGLLATPAHAVGLGSAPIPSSLSSLVSALLAPSFLWLTLTIVLGSALRQPSRVASTCALYMLAAFACRLFTSALFLVPMLLGCVLCKLASGLLMYAELAPPPPPTVMVAAAASAGICLLPISSSAAATPATTAARDIETFVITEDDDDVASRNQPQDEHRAAARHEAEPAV